LYKNWRTVKVSCRHRWRYHIGRLYPGPARSIFRD